MLPKGVAVTLIAFILSIHSLRENDAESAARRYVQYAQGKRYKSRFFSEDNVFSEEKFINHIKGMLDYFSMIAVVNGRHSRPLQSLWSSFYDLTKHPVLEMLPERSIFKTEVAVDFAFPGDESKGVYVSSGTAFLLNTGFIVTARHCIKSQKPSELDVVYDDGSTCELVNHWEIRTHVKYAEFNDNIELDWASCEKAISIKNCPGLSCDAKYAVQCDEMVTAYGYAGGDSRLRRIEARVVDVSGSNVFVDRPFISGMSGGPVFNSRGDVIGIVAKGSEEGSYDFDGGFVRISNLPFCYLRHWD